MHTKTTELISIVNVNVCRCSSRRNPQSRNPEGPPSLNWWTVSRCKDKTGSIREPTVGSIWSSSEQSRWPQHVYPSHICCARSCQSELSVANLLLQQRLQLARRPLVQPPLPRRTALSRCTCSRCSRATRCTCSRCSRATRPVAGREGGARAGCGGRLRSWRPTARRLSPVQGMKSKDTAKADLSDADTVSEAQAHPGAYTK